LSYKREEKKMKSSFQAFSTSDLPSLEGEDKRKFLAFGWYCFCYFVAKATLEVYLVLSTL